MEACATVKAVRGRFLGLALAAGIGLVAVGLGTAARGGGGAGATSTSTSTSTSTRLRAEGRVATLPGAEVTIGAEVGGRITAVSVVEKALVKRGDILVEIDDVERRAAVLEARAQAAEAEAERGFRDRDVARLKAARRTAGVSDQMLDQAERDLAVAGARRDLAAAAVERLEAVLEKTRIRAPIDGTVIARRAHPGETVAPGTPLLAIADLGRVRIEAEVDEFDAGRMAVGAAVTITAEGYDGKAWRGRVAEVPDSVVPRRMRPQDPASPIDSRVLIVKVALLDETPLKLGQRVEVAIESGATEKSNAEN